MKDESREDSEELRNALDAGGAVPAPGDLPFRDYADRFLEQKKETMRPSAVNNYIRVIGKLTDEIDRKAIRAITGEDIGRLYKSIRSQGYAEQTTHGYMGRVRAVFSFAVRQGDIPVSPFQSLSIPAPRKERRPAATLEEVRTLLAASEGTPAYTSILLAFSLGLQEAEICGLRFDDFDFEQGTVHIQREVARRYDENGAVCVDVTDVEPENRNRILSLPKATQKHVRELLELREDPERYPYVVKGCGKPFLQPKSIGIQYSKLRDRLGLKVKFRDIRNAFGVVCHRYGAPLDVIQIAMGHADIKTTAEICLGASEGMEAVSKSIDSVFDSVLKDV